MFLVFVLRESHNMALQNPPVKALFFDVFGTCVDWRTTVTRTLANSATDALNSDRRIDENVRHKASRMVGTTRVIDNRHVDQSSHLKDVCGLG